MDTLASLANGFRRRLHAGQPDVVPDRHDARHSDRRAAGPRPGADHRASAADHLSGRAGGNRSSSSPASITAPCMAARRPRSCSTRRAKAPPSSTALEGNKMARSRARRRRTRDGGDRLLRRRHNRHDRRHLPGAGGGRAWALAFGPAEYFSLMVLAFVMVSAVLGSSSVRGLATLVLRLLPRHDRRRHPDRPARASPSALPSCSTASSVDHRRGRPLRGRRDALRRLAPLRRQGRDRAAEGLALDDRAGMVALVEGVDARRAHRLPDRRAAGGRRRNPDLPLLCVGEEAVEAKEEFGTTGAIEGVAGPEAANNASAAGRAGADADARPADLGHGRDHAVGLPELRHQAGAAAADHAGEPRCGA